MRPACQSAGRELQAGPESSCRSWPRVGPLTCRFAGNEAACQRDPLLPPAGPGWGAPRRVAPGSVVAPDGAPGAAGSGTGPVDPGPGDGAPPRSRLLAWSRPQPRASRPPSTTSASPLFIVSPLVPAGVASTTAGR